MATSDRKRALRHGVMLDYVEVRQEGGKPVYAPAVAVFDSNPIITATEVVTGTGDVQGIAATAGLRLLGFIIQNDHASSIAKATLRHGTSSAGAAVASASAEVDESKPYFLPGGGVPVASGVFVDRNGVDSTLILYTAVIS